jgi:hypothetical protein
MRVFTTKKSIVDLKHFRYCAKHYDMLLTLQQETPNLMLEVNQQNQRAFVPIHQLDLDDPRSVSGLNPNDAHAV